MKKLIGLVVVSATSIVVTAKHTKEGFKTRTLVDHADIDTTKRPVIGILTEPMRGEIVKSDTLRSE